MSIFSGVFDDDDNQEYDATARSITTLIKNETNDWLTHQAKQMNVTRGSVIDNIVSLIRDDEVFLASLREYTDKTYNVFS